MPLHSPAGFEVAQPGGMMLGDFGRVIMDASHSVGINPRRRDFGRTRHARPDRPLNGHVACDWCVSMIRLCTCHFP